jgi:hypothetical protein
MDRVAPVRFPGSASVSVSRCDTSGVWERVPAAQRRFCSATCSRTEQNGRRSFSERSRCAVHGQIHEGTESAGGPWMSLGVPGHGLCPLRHSQESRVDRVVAIPHLDEGLRSMAKVAVPVRLRPEAGCHCPATTCRILPDPRPPPRGPRGGRSWWRGRRDAAAGTVRRKRAPVRRETAGSAAVARSVSIRRGAEDRAGCHRRAAPQVSRAQG